MSNESKKHFAIVDYGMGNLQSVLNALNFLGQDASIVTKPEEIRNAGAIIIPGVGAFSKAMNNIQNMGIIDILNVKVLVEKTPFLGICLGMQLIAEYSTEGGKHKGLGWIPGHVDVIPVKKGTRLPHVGWNEIKVHKEEPLYRKISQDFNFYFVHSFCMNCDPEYISASCLYDVEITASIQKDNIFATQFHPEKSQSNGLKVLRQFINVVNEKVQGGIC